MLRSRWRRLASPALGLLAAVVFLAAIAHADDYEERRRPGRCYCHKGQGTWEYLRSPLVPPEDPSHCGLVLDGGTCRERPRPKGVSGVCWGHQKEACFWQRHAYSWDIRCSLCWSDDTCTECDSLIADRDEVTRAKLAERVASEAKTLGPSVVVAWSPHFYVVTNADKRIKLLTRRGTRRMMSAHEVLHLYLQRCELAYADFMHWFGGDVNLHKPMAVYVVDEESTRKSIGARYFGGEGIHMNYAFAYNDRIAEGFCGNGLVVGQEHEGNDTYMHGYCRHQIGHILFSCWQKHGGFEEELPRWAWVGAAHFLAKLLPLHEDYATYCFGEGSGGEGPRKRWPKRVHDLAAGKLTPIETFFNKNDLSAVKYEDHLRAWSIMDLMLREDRTRWLRLLERLRNREDEGKACLAELGIKPDEFNKRWVDRVLGRRKTMGEVRGDGAESEAPGLRERRRLESTEEVDELAGLIKGLDVIDDLATLEAVLGRLGHPSDLVRETLHLVLARTKSPAVRAFLREQALYDSRDLVRAGVVRALGALGDTEARERIERMLADGHWLVRANAAQALQRLADRASRPALLEALSDAKPKPWIAAADAFASFPGRSRQGTLALLAGLDHKRWQVRLTAVRALARVGTLDAMDALIERFAKEDGLLERELREALKAVRGDDLGPRASTWRTWWDEPPPREGPPPTTGEQRYAEPTRRRPDDPHYYGRRIFSKSVCFVLDTSRSMELNMKVRPEEVARLGDLPAEGTRDEIAKKALTQALDKLDPRTRIRLVFFGSNVRLWKKELLPATPANLDSARMAIRNARPDGETNFHGALKAALGLDEKPTLDPRLEDIPDTVYFLTDGRPTRGEITAMPELISWFADLNRFAKVTLHVIALGELNIDAPRLRQLAEAGGGEMIHVREQ